MANNITLKENEPTEVTFKYGNVTKSKSKKDDSVYYVFDCDEGRINASAALAQLIADNWCGRGGTMKIEKLNKTRFDVEVIDPAERIYPLEMRAWDDSIGGFAEIEFDISGATPAQSSSGAKAESSPPAAKKSGGVPAPSLDTYASLMSHCIQLATAMCGEEITEPQQKIAVTLFMEAARKGLAVEMEEEEETNDTGEETDEKEEQEAPRKLTKSDIEEDDLPF
jgi:hypothetical protein